MSTENALYTILLDKLRHDKLVLPSLPETAHQVCQVCEQPLVSLQDVEKVMERDPAITVRVIRIANSAMFMRSRNVATLKAALVRIGLRAVRNIAIAVAMEQLFQSDNPIIDDYLRRCWRQSIAVASAAAAASYDYIDGENEQGLQSDIVLLSGLLHQVGTLPILAEAALHEEVFANPSFLQSAIERLRGPLSAAVAECWGLGEPYAWVAEYWADLNVTRSTVDYIDFVRIGAIYHGELMAGTPHQQQLKPFVDKGALLSTNLFSQQAFDERYQAYRAQFK